MRDCFKTAAHIFKMCEKCKCTIRELFQDNGVWEIPQEEINKLSRVMSEKDVQWVVDELIRSSNAYNDYYISAETEMEKREMFDASAEMAKRAAMWAISKPLSV